MDTLSLLFRSSVRWNTFGALTYQLLLVIHQAALYKCMLPTLYGSMSILLSTIYLGAVIADAGFDAALSTFFTTLTQKRSLFIKSVAPHFLSVIINAMLLSTLFVSLHQILFKTLTLSPLVITATVVILFTESLRRSLRMTLQLAFKAKIVSLLDSSMMIVYLIGIWSAYAVGASLSLELLMGGLALASIIFTFMILFFVYRWLQELSDTVVDHHTVAQRAFLFQRLASGSNTLTHQLFSGNVLVPLVGMSSGLADAGLVKLASYLAHGLVTITRKIVGSSGSALLAALKNTSWHLKRPAFWQLSNTLYTTLFFSGIAMASMSSHLASSMTVTTHQATILLLVILLILSEGLCLAYETLFIIEERAFYALALNGTVSLLAGLLIFSTSTLSLTMTLTIILGLRLLLFSAMATMAVYLWHLYPPTPSITRRLVTRTALLTGLAYLLGTPLALLLTR